MFVNGRISVDTETVEGGGGVGSFGGNEDESVIGIVLGEAG